MTLSTRRLFTTSLAGLLLCLAIAIPASAQSTWNAFDAKRLQALLLTMGATSATVEKADRGGTPIDVVYFTSGNTRYVAVPIVCKASGCLGLSMVVLWKNELKATAEVANAFNNRSDFGRGFVTEDGGHIGYGRYAIADGGVSEENVKSNLVNFTGNAAEFVKFVRSKQIVAMQPASPLAPTLMSAPAGDTASPSFVTITETAGVPVVVNDPAQVVVPLAPLAHGTPAP
jgi:hypothetical protein